VPLRTWLCAGSCDRRRAGGELVAGLWLLGPTADPAGLRLALGLVGGTSAMNTEDIPAPGGA
jgi:hypothetical protein